MKEENGYSVSTMLRRLYSSRRVVVTIWYSGKILQSWDSGRVSISSKVSGIIGMQLQFLSYVGHDFKIRDTDRYSFRFRFRFYIVIFFSQMAPHDLGDPLPKQTRFISRKNQDRQAQIGGLLSRIRALPNTGRARDGRRSFGNTWCHKGQVLYQRRVSRKYNARNT